MEEKDSTPETIIVLRHKKERKELQAEIQKLKHAVQKGDKKKKKEVMAQVALMEAQLDEKHYNEQQQLNQIKNVTGEMASTTLSSNYGNHEQTDGERVTHDDKKISKAQKRRDVKAAREREREANIAAQDIENLSGDRHIEASKMKILLATRGLAIYQIASDGDCLYAAVADQLARLGVEESVHSLRRQTADHMRQQIDDFLPFLCKPETGNPYTQEEYLDYCERIEKTPVWGDQLELRALSNVLGRPIEVLQADAPDLLTGDEYSTDKLILSYHRHMYGLGEHYNSVVDKSQVPEDEEDEGKEFT